jgi:hypothetical protein
MKRFIKRLVRLILSMFNREKHQGLNVVVSEDNKIVRKQRFNFLYVTKAYRKVPTIQK